MKNHRNLFKEDDMKTRHAKGILFLMTLILVAGNGLTSAQSLQEIAKEEGFTWLAGRWTATTDDGDSIDLALKWMVGGHVATMDFAMGETSYHGMIHLSDSEDQAVEIGFDNKGDKTKATWEPRGDKIVSIREKVGDYGDVQKMGIVFAKGKGRTLTCSIHGIQYGDISDDAEVTIDFKRKTARKNAGTGAKRTKK
jgi:hypothetical protein